MWRERLGMGWMGWDGMGWDGMRRGLCAAVVETLID